MKPPEGIIVNEEITSQWWIDEKGIICSVSKKNGIDITREEMISQFSKFKKENENKKVCILFDISHAQPGKKMTKEKEDLMEELGTMISAMAIISSSALGRLLANLFFNLKAPSFPMKVFNNESDARHWLIQYL
jgi:hypothetical protein